MILLLIGFSLISSLFWHTLWRNFWGACMGAAITCFGLSMVIAFNYVGGWWGDLFFKYSIGAIPTALIVSVIVGALLRQVRRTGVQKKTSRQSRRSSFLKRRCLRPDSARLLRSSVRSAGKSGADFNSRFDDRNQESKSAPFFFFDSDSFPIAQQAALFQSLKNDP